MRDWYPLKPAEGARSPGVGVTGVCDLILKDQRDLKDGSSGEMICFSTTKPSKTVYMQLENLLKYSSGSSRRSKVLD